MAAGPKLEELFKGLAMLPATYDRWLKQKGRAVRDTVLEFKGLKREAAPLKCPVADMSLQKPAIRGLAARGWQARRD